jgi:hypothetical protein
MDLGEADITSLPFSANLHMKGNVVYAGYKSNDRFGWIAKGGAYSFTTELSDSGSSFEEDSSGLALGGGFIYTVTPAFAVRAEVECFIGVSDFADDGDVVTVSGGIEFRF